MNQAIELGLGPRGKIAGRYLLGIQAVTAVVALIVAGGSRVSFTAPSAQDDPGIVINVPETLPANSPGVLSLRPRPKARKTSVKVRLSLLDPKGLPGGSAIQNIGPQILSPGKPDGLSIPLGVPLKRASAGWTLITCIETQPVDEGSGTESPRHYCYRSRVVAE